jgi:hypothetical protein
MEESFKYMHRPMFVSFTVVYTRRVHLHRIMVPLTEKEDIVTLPLYFQEKPATIDKKRTIKETHSIFQYSEL